MKSLITLIAIFTCQFSFAGMVDDLRTDVKYEINGASIFTNAETDPEGKAVSISSYDVLLYSSHPDFDYFVIRVNGFKNYSEASAMADDLLNKDVRLTCSFDHDLYREKHAVGCMPTAIFYKSKQ